MDIDIESYNYTINTQQANKRPTIRLMCPFKVNKVKVL